MPKKKGSRHTIVKKKHKNSKNNYLKETKRKLKKVHTNQKGGFFWMLPLLALLKWRRGQQDQE